MMTADWTDLVQDWDN